MNPDSLTRRDRWLEARVAGLLEHDERLKGIDDVEVRFDGGVAHAEGGVDSPEQRALLRDAVCSLRGVHAFWDRITIGAAAPLRTLDVGCGGTKQKPQSLGVDRFAAPGVGVLADLTAPLPFADRSVDRVHAVHVLEHVLDLVAVMDELHRVIADDGVLHVLSPHWQSIAAVADPTHVKYLDVQTFKWFCTPRPGARTWFPLHASYDGASVFADLVPVRSAHQVADADALARWFD